MPASIVFSPYRARATRGRCSSSLSQGLTRELGLKGCEGLAFENTVDANGNPTGDVISALGNGDSTFQPVVTIAGLTGPPTGLAIADLNHAGRLDIVVSNIALQSFVPNGARGCPLVRGTIRGTTKLMSFGVFRCLRSP